MALIIPVNLLPCGTAEQSILESCRQKEEIKKVCLRVNSKLYLHLSKQKKSLFLANTWPDKMTLRPAANSVPASSNPTYCSWQSQQPCHALESAVTEVFDSLFWFALCLIMSVKDLGDVAGQRCNKWNREGTWHLPAKLIMLWYVCACT